MSISQKLYSLRIDNDTTQEELAKILGVDRKTISRAETGTTEPKIELLIKYAKHYNVSLDYICDLTNQPKTIEGEKTTTYNKKINIQNNGLINIKQ